MARETAYRLRRKAGAEEFARAWDAALRSARTRFGWSPRGSADELYTVPPKVSPGDLWRRIVDGRWRPVLRRGKYVGSVQKADNSALLSHIAQIEGGFRAERKALRQEVRSQLRKSRNLCEPRGSKAGSPEA